VINQSFYSAAMTLNNQKWKDLPLHCCFRARNATDAKAIMLINADPKSVNIKESENLLSLACATKQRHTILKKIVEIYPKACELGKNLPLHYILMNGDGAETMENLRLLLDASPGTVKSKGFWNKVNTYRFIFYSLSENPMTIRLLVII
jgi:hypothetical protein